VVGSTVGHISIPCWPPLMAYPDTIYVRIRGKGSLRWGAIEAEELSGKEASWLPEDAGWADKSTTPKL